MSFWVCQQLTCDFSKRQTYSTYTAIFRHYYKKGREVLIELAKQTGVSIIPYSEPSYILADKLVKISKVEREN